MSKHTSGPWVAATSGPTMRGYGQPFAIAEKGKANLIGGVFADVAGGAAVATANARLIAAAPLLLEALRDMVSDRECLSEATVNFARAAIAAATGENT